MRRDASTPVLLGLLLLLVAAPLEGFSGSWLSATAPSALALLAFAVVAWCAVVVPSLESARPVRVVEAALVSAPFAVALLRLDPLASVEGVPGLIAVFAAGLHVLDGHFFTFGV